MEKKIVGYIYILTNPSFEEYVKIGYADNVETRVNELNRSDAVPFAFRPYASYAVTERLGDKKLHSIIDKLNPKLRSVDNIDGKIRKREYYNMTPEDAFGLFEAMAHIHDCVDRLYVYPITKEQIEDERLAESIRHKAPNKDFYTMGLKDGDEIYLIKKPELKAVIAGANAVTFNDSAPMRITALSNMLFEQYNLGIPHLGGFEYFAYDDQDKNLYDRYNRIKRLK